MSAPLRRVLTVTSAAALVVSNMIGTGIFTTTGFLAGDLGRPLLVLGIWVAGGIVALAGCFAYAELGMNIPRAGGEYAYLREAWGPGWAFLSGWISFFAGFSAPIAATALAFSEYLGNYFPVLAANSAQGTHSRWLHARNGEWVSIGVIFFFAVINILGLHLASKLQNFLTALKLGIIAVFLVSAFALGRGDWAHFQMATARSSSHGLGAQFAVSLIFVMFAYSGWNAASYVAEEIKDPQRTLPLALGLGTGLVALLYVALNVAFVYALPLGAMKGVVAVGAASSDALFGRRAGNFFSAAMAGALLSSISAMSLVGPRVYYAMGRDGCFPAGAAEVHPSWGTPVRAICYQAIVSALMVLTGAFEALIYYIGFSLILFAALAVAGLLRVRKRPGFLRLRVVSWGYPAIPLLFVGVSFWMLVWTFLLRPRESSLGLVTILCGAIFYRWRLRGSVQRSAPERQQAAP
ncbi:MAG: amino acid permease [Acidobacteria bacterium]|nr:MAG: amino acid permease [Acidobacteriota bacterium]